LNTKLPTAQPTTSSQTPHLEEFGKKIGFAILERAKEVEVVVMLAISRTSGGGNMGVDLD